MNTPDLSKNENSFRFTAEKFFSEKNVFETCEIVCNEKYFLENSEKFEIEKLKIKKEDLILKIEEIGIFRFLNNFGRDEAISEILKFQKMAIENKLIEEAAEVLADFESNR